MRIVLLEPEIPQNTGSIARLAAATRSPLDLVGPLGFSLEDRYLKRAGLDYWPFVELEVYRSWEDYLSREHEGRLLALSARVGLPYTRCRFRGDDRLLFGKETKGLGPEILAAMEGQTYRIPIKEAGVRSLNLANSVSIVLYEGLRQLGELV
ncbi:MAG: tRNA (cytidine(34)-2'-O)-methyltransferase [Candidatus Binatia bacterium]